MYARTKFVGNQLDDMCVQLHDTLVGRGHITDQRGVRAYWCAGPCSCVWLGTDACAASCRVVPTRAARQAENPQEGAPRVRALHSCALRPARQKRYDFSEIAGCFAGPRNTADSSHWPLATFSLAFFSLALARSSPVLICTVLSAAKTQSTVAIIRSPRMHAAFPTLHTTVYDRQASPTTAITPAGLYGPVWLPD